MKENTLRLQVDEYSPITGNMCVMVEKNANVIYKMCMESGFVTDSFLKESEKLLSDLEKNFPIGFRNHVTDSFGYVWVPMSNATEKAAIFPIEKEEGKLEWGVADITPAGEANEDGSIPMQVDVENALYFDKLEFSDAFSAFMSKAFESDLSLETEEV